MIKLTELRLEMVRLMREHSYGMADVENPTCHDEETLQAAEWALDQPVETMAGWVDLSDTVMANLRQVYVRYQESLVD
jgi:hypothetical protein